MSTDILTTAKIAGSTFLCVLIGSAIPEPDTLSANTHVPLGIAVSFLVAMVGAAFAISRKITQWENRMSEMEKTLKNFPCVGEKCMQIIHDIEAPHFQTPKP